jgi:alcohol dehydrogenase, propanol-preferring
MLRRIKRALQLCVKMRIGECPMRAMVLAAPGAALTMQGRPDPAPGAGEVRVKVSACGVCRTDLHVVDGELPDIRYPIVPGHEIVGRIDAVGSDVTNLAPGMRVGVPWLGWTCGHCTYCETSQENLCDRPLFTGYTSDGGFATHLIGMRATAFRSARPATTPRSRPCSAPA